MWLTWLFTVASLTTRRTRGPAGRRTRPVRDKNASGGPASRRAAEASWSTQAEVDRRDRMDAAQSGKAADAVEVDSTELDLDGVVGVIVGLVPKPLQKSR